MKPKNKSTATSVNKQGSKVVDYSNDPFFVKKHELAQRKLEKVIFPKELLEGRK